MVDWLEELWRERERECVSDLEGKLKDLSLPNEWKTNMYTQTHTSKQTVRFLYGQSIRLCTVLHFVCAYAFDPLSLSLPSSFPQFRWFDFVRVLVR